LEWFSDRNEQYDYMDRLFDVSLSIWWIRRDLRLADNLALNAAINESSEILPLFIVDRKLIQNLSIGEKRLSFLWAGLRQLDSDLRDRGSHLTIREGDPLAILTQLIAQTGAGSIFAESDFSPYALSRDRRIRQELPLKLMGNPGLRHPKDVLKNDGTPYTVFSPYMRAWKNLSLSSFGSLLPVPDRINTPHKYNNMEIPVSSDLSFINLFQPGETIAHDQLRAFMNGDDPMIYCYDRQRDRVDMQGTSQLSPYLRFGMISARQVINGALDASHRSTDKYARKSVDTWINELIWRDFYISILYHFPQVLKRSFRGEWREISWINNEQDYLSWCYGRTGYPIIDAAMRQLITTGWMHNRARMITASFLVKDLLIDWRWGERWFKQHLIDFDPAANNGGWQWTAGTGTDAVPYFRIFNPVLQSQKYDPQGNYARKWISELEKVPEKFIHEPWKMPINIQKLFDCQIGVDYPQPIVNHAWARERALDVYRTAKTGSSIKS
jgi:deoxyribodipyrimidine photo-lyase